MRAMMDNKTIGELHREATATLSFLQRRGDYESSAHEAALALMEAVELLKAVLVADCPEDILPKAEAIVAGWNERWKAQSSWFDHELVEEELSEAA
jgi:hypothetical protein